MTDTKAPEPDELTKVARDLSEIVNLAFDLRWQAAADSDDHDMPGGDALASLAPVASPEAWEHQYEAREALGRPTDHVNDEREDVELQTILFWSEQWRVEHGKESDRRPTFGSEVGFLRQVLQWAWEREIHWKDFAGDIRSARIRLENILHAGKRQELTRVPCIDCEAGPRLIKIYAAAVAYDHFKCPRCKRRYSEDDFTRAKHQQLASEGAERFVKLQDALGSIDRPERTFRRWMEDGHIETQRNTVTGQVWVWWPDVHAIHRITPRRARRTA